MQIETKLLGPVTEQPTADPSPVVETRSPSPEPEAKKK